MDARKLAELLYLDKLNAVYHGEHDLGYHFAINCLCLLRRACRKLRRV